MKANYTTCCHFPYEDHADHVITTLCGVVRGEFRFVYRRFEESERTGCRSAAPGDVSEKSVRGYPFSQAEPLVGVRAGRRCRTRLP